MCGVALKKIHDELPAKLKEVGIRFHVPEKIVVRQLKKLRKRIRARIKADGIELVSGKGKRKTRLQRLSEWVDQCLAKLKKRAEVCLLILSIGNSVLQLACRTGNCIQPCPVRFENRSRLLLALDEAFFCLQFFKLMFQLKQPVTERIALRSLTGLCIDAFGRRFQPLPAHVRPASICLRMSVYPQAM